MSRKTLHAMIFSMAMNSTGKGPRKVGGKEGNNIVVIRIKLAEAVTLFTRQLTM